MSKIKHPHPHSDELHVFLIPARQEEEMELIVLPNKADALSRTLKAEQLYVVHEDLGLPALLCGCPLSMALDHQNILPSHQLEPNLRASLFFNGEDCVYGDVLMVGQGMVQYSNGHVDVDFISLTPEFHDWRGPGHPLPPRKMPWNS